MGNLKKGEEEFRTTSFITVNAFSSIVSRSFSRGWNDGRESFTEKDKFLLGN